MSVIVFARFRPETQECSSKSVPNGLNLEQPGCIHVTQRSQFHEFVFDRVFKQDSTQEELFEAVGVPTIQDIFQGYNTTIFVYGQTGSGKSHTMTGKVDDKLNMGITPRLVDALFKTIEDAPANLEFTVKLSYIEIYLERLRCLLNPAAAELTVRENPNSGVWIEGGAEPYVNGADQVRLLLERGMNNRSIAATRMNLESSRSHSVFILVIGKLDTDTGCKTSSTLFLVDLAGSSEKLSKTGAAGQTLKEAQHINKSLSALGNVINALTENRPHIPYRDSKLTRLLSDALGGNAKTYLVITASTSLYNLDETISTLRFGQRAKSVKNKAIINSEKSPGEYRRLLEALQQRCNECELEKEKMALTIRSLKEASIPNSTINPSLPVSNMLSDFVYDGPNSEKLTIQKLSDNILEYHKRLSEHAADADQWSDRFDTMNADLEISTGALQAEREKNLEQQKRLDILEHTHQQDTAHCHHLESTLRSTQAMLCLSQSQCEEESKQSLRNKDLDIRNVELQNALSAKVQQNVDLAMKLEDCEAQLNALFADRNDPDKAEHHYDKIESNRLQRELDRTIAAQDLLQLELGSALAEMRQGMRTQQVEFDRKNTLHQLENDDLIAVMQNNASIYRSGADRTAARILELETELGQYRKFYVDYTSSVAPHSTFVPTFEVTPSIASNTLVKRNSVAASGMECGLPGSRLVVPLQSRSRSYSASTDNLELVS